MQYFVGIVPPNEYKQQIVKFQQKWDSNTMWKLVEPHITVKAQSGLTPDLAWLDEIRRVCASFAKFTISLSHPETFADAVAYLSVQSPELRLFHEQLVAAVSPPPEVMSRYYGNAPIYPAFNVRTNSLGNEFARNHGDESRRID